MIEGILKVILGLVGLTLVVSVHELGHLLAARVFKIDVLTFSVGIGKKLIVLKGERTEWALSLLPLGGYCRLKGEQNFIQAWEEKSDTIPYEEGSLFSAPWWQRVIVSLAGPAANLVFGALILSLIFLIRYPQTYVDPYVVPVSHYLEDDSQQSPWPADLAGLEKGDKIVSLDNRKLKSYSQIQELVILAGDKTLSMTVERAGNLLTKEITPALNRETGAGYIGVYPWIGTIIKELPSGTPFTFLEPGDQITGINGKPVECTMDFYQVLEDSSFLLESLTAVREGSLLEITPDLQLIREDVYPVFDFSEELSPSYGPLGALSAGTAEMAHLLVRTVESMGLLFKGIKLQNALSGPLKISWMTGEVAMESFSRGFRAGLYQIIRFLALICGALAFANLLPIPVLDGGQILLHIFDGLRRKPLTPNFVYYYQMAGTIVVIFLALFATGNDLLFFLRSQS